MVKVVKDRPRSSMRADSVVRAHDALVQSVGVDFVTLLVDSAHPKVQALYEKWGYEKQDEGQALRRLPAVRRHGQAQ